MKFLRGALLGGAALLVSSTVVMADAPNDPYEETNREIFQFNMGLDQAVMEPVSRGYRFVVPEPARMGVSNALENLSEPRTLFNNILQGDAEAAWHTFLRFTINSTIGLGGLFDVTTAGNFERRKEDFGQTLAVWGYESGPYLMLPLLGPSTGRDTAGFVVDTVTDPFSLVFGFVPSMARTGTRLVDNRSERIEEFEALEATAIDLYASVRTLYYQNREHEIRNGAPPPLDDLYRDLELEKDVRVSFPATRTN
ncbi:MAG: VacJ family lipoprotein [Minwuia sp.]|uniref:MlaA family lipoprotein n=1 Tax=Minwuia sp. TaxID=2493630 RepID=UPI003A8B2C92